MPWIVDGNNLAGGGDRSRVRQAALAVARRERVRILVFFDGAPPQGSLATEKLGTVEVRYVPHADTAIVEFLRGAGRGWRLATDDRRLGVLARDRGAELVGGAAFWRKAAVAEQDGPGGGAAGADLVEELAYFHDPAQRLTPAPRRIVRRRSRKKD